MAAKLITKSVGIAAFVLGIIMFIIPYLMDVANRAIRAPDWWQTHTGVVAYFWSNTDMVWAAAAGLVIVGLALFAGSFALKS